MHLSKTPKRSLLGLQQLQSMSGLTKCINSYSLVKHPCEILNGKITKPIHTNRRFFYGKCPIKTYSKDVSEPEIFSKIKSAMKSKRWQGAAYYLQHDPLRSFASCLFPTFNICIGCARSRGCKSLPISKNKSSTFSPVFAEVSKKIASIWFAYNIPSS